MYRFYSTSKNPANNIKHRANNNKRKINTEMLLRLFQYYLYLLTRVSVQHILPGPNNFDTDSVLIMFGPGQHLSSYPNREQHELKTETQTYVVVSTISFLYFLL